MNSGRVDRRLVAGMPVPRGIGGQAELSRMAAEFQGFSHD
jgi:hypothetical protein